MSQNKPVRLVFNLTPSGIHDAAWKQQESPATLSTDIDQLVESAKIAERGKLDAIFMPDSYGGLNKDDPPRRPWRSLDPTVVFAAIAVATDNIGLIATVNSLYNAPYQVARDIASLDHLSRGRAGWNVITSQNANSLDILGIDEVYERDEKYERAEEFLTIVHLLWESLPQEAILADAASHTYIDLDRAREVDFTGKHFSSKGISPVPPFEGNKPVIVQAGASQQSKEFGARWADALFTKHRTIESGQTFTRDARAFAEKAGRSADDILVLPGLLPILGSTEAEAKAIKRELDEQLDIEYLKAALAERLGIEPSQLDPAKELPYDAIEIENATPYDRQQRGNLVQEAKDRGFTTLDVLYNNITAGHRVVVGTPEQLADDFVAWIDADASDGFAFNVESNPRGIEAIVDGLVPELQKRGRFRTDYDGTTFRSNLGVGSGTKAPR
ncbi:NtaA/DmoA family FMN-dependent monooxygenase [Aeromicrobium panaciterrae]|uniref:NtaA/DmoA family FMN-dependent monooxygenase n=1 Tax=Aeromicrobium panaciterrae TaxID=363861 RepID=UPI0031D2D4C4